MLRVGLNFRADCQAFRNPVLPTSERRHEPPAPQWPHPRFGSSLVGLCVALADGGSGRTEESDDLGGSEEYPADQRDIAKPSREIIQLASEDQHGAGDGDRGQRNEPGDRSGD